MRIEETNVRTVSESAALLTEEKSGSSLSKTTRVSAVRSETCEEPQSPGRMF